MKISLRLLIIILIFIVCSSTNSNAYTFDIIAPSLVEVNTSTISNFSTQRWEWIVNTSGTITYDNLTYELTAGAQISDPLISVYHMQVYNAHLFTPMAQGNIAGIEDLLTIYEPFLLTDEIPPSSKYGSVTQMGFNSSQSPQYIGSTSLEAFVRIGDEIANYTVIVEFINDPAKDLIKITEGQRVSSINSPFISEVPISGSFWLLGSGLPYIFLKRRKKANKSLKRDY